MDVLDHFCSRTGFGGKMCMDGTGAPSGRNGRPLRYRRFCARSERAALQAVFPEIKSVNVSLLVGHSPASWWPLKATASNHLRELHPQLYAQPGTEGIKTDPVHAEHTVDPQGSARTLAVSATTSTLNATTS